jgi:hypothetical protein
VNKFSKITIFSAIVLVMVAGVFNAMAADSTGGSPKDSPIKDIGQLMNILRSIVNVLYTAFFIVAIGFVILAAFDYLTGSDNPEKIKGASKKIVYAAIAIAVALLSVGANAIIKSFIEQNR